MNLRPVRRHQLGARMAISLVALSLIAIAVGPPAADAVEPLTTTRVSESTTHGQGNGVSDDSYISADGRYVTYRSTSSNLVAGDTNGVLDVFVHDRLTETTSRASTDASGVEGNAQSDDSAISADGRYVVFRSQASNFVTGDTNGTSWDIFLKDLQTGAIVRVSTSSAGAQSNGASHDPVVSADGRYVAFRSSASNLVAGDVNGQQDIFRKDIETGTTILVSVSSAGVQGNALADDPQISDDGNRIAFHSDATTLVSGDTNGHRDVFVRDVSAGTTVRVSVSTSGSQGNGASAEASISGDGTTVAYQSDASTLVSGDTNAKTDVFVHVLATGVTSRVSVSASGAQQTKASEEPSLSGDGSIIAFDSLGSSLVSGDTNSRKDIFIKDLVTGTVTRMSVDTAGVQGNDTSRNASLSGDGTTVAFESDSTNLVATDTNGTQDVFVRGPSVAGSVAWSVPAVALSLRRGTSYTEALWLDVSADASDVSLEVSPSLADVIEAFEIPDPYDLATGEEYFPITFDIPKAAALGLRTGTVAVRSSSGQLLAELTVNLEVTEPLAGVVPPTLAHPASSRIGPDDEGLPVILDQILVGIDTGALDPEQRILAIAGAHNAIVMGSIPELRMYQLLLDVTDLADLEVARQAISTEANVVFASLSLLGRTSARVPNDPEWGDPWDESNVGGANWAMELIRMPTAWETETGDSTVRVGVIDVGIDVTHPDLAPNVGRHVEIRKRNKNEHHGTHTAGIACAKGDNLLGVTGVAWDCSIRAYELGRQNFSPEDVAQAMLLAALDGARVVNMSVGWYFLDCDGGNANKLDRTEAIFDDAFKKLRDEIGADVLWVISAGNESCDASNVVPANQVLHFPDSIVTVTSVNQQGGLSDFSDYGGAITVAAPGGNGTPLQTILSTCPVGTEVNPELVCSASGYVGNAGTSMAAPHVTGLAALILSEHPTLSASDLKDCIVDAANEHGRIIANQPFRVVDAPSAVMCEAPASFEVPYGADGWRFQQYAAGTVPSDWWDPALDESAFQPGTAAFGEFPIGGGCPLFPTVNTAWTVNTEIVVRRHIETPAGGVHLEVGVAIDNDVHVRWNGLDISGGIRTHEGCPALDMFVFDVPAGAVLENNVLAVHGVDRGSESYLNIRVTPVEP